MRIVVVIVIVAASITRVLTPSAFADDTPAIAFDTIEEAQPNSPDFPKRTFEQDFQLAMRPTYTCSATLLRRYLSVDRERIDDECHRVTMIVDCKTRTVLQTNAPSDIDRSKVYGVTSFDATPNPEYAAALAENKRMQASAKIHNVVLEHRTANGPNRYNVVREQTLSDAVTGTLYERDTMNYAFSKARLPRLRCDDVAAPYFAQFRALDQYMPELPPEFFKTQAIATATYPDKLTEVGPAVPQWRIVQSASGSHFQTQTRALSSTNYFKVESGHIRTISKDDPVFNVPAGYVPTK